MHVGNYLGLLDSSEQKLIDARTAKKFSVLVAGEKLRRIRLQQVVRNSHF